MTFRVNQRLAKTPASVNYRSARPPHLIQIVPRYSRYTQLPRSLSDDLDCQQSLGAPRAPWGSAAFPLGVGPVCGVGLSKSLMRDKLH